MKACGGHVPLMPTKHKGACCRVREQKKHCTSCDLKARHAVCCGLQGFAAAVVDQPTLMARACWTGQLALMVPCSGGSEARTCGSRQQVVWCTAAATAVSTSPVIVAVQTKTGRSHLLAGHLPAEMPAAAGSIHFLSHPRHTHLQGVPAVLPIRRHECDAAPVGA